MGRSTLPVRASGIRPGVMRTVVIWEIVLAIIALGVLTNSRVGWSVAGVVMVMAILLGAPFGGRSLLERIELRLAYQRRNRRKVVDPDLPADIVPLAQWAPDLEVHLTRSTHGQEIGVISADSSWTALLRINDDDNLLSDQGGKLDLSALSGLTVQDDIVFSALQVVTYTVPAPVAAILPSGSAVVESYRTVAGDDIPPAIRRTWLSVRLDPRLCLEAIARRGASTEAIYATLRFGLHRVQSTLKRQGIETSILTPDDIYHVLAMTSGATPERSETRSVEDWQQWECDGLHHQGRHITDFGSNPSLGYQALLNQVATAHVLFGVTSFTFDQANHVSGAVRLAAVDAASTAAALSGLVTGLKGELRFAPPGGTQVPSVLATVPLARVVAA